MADFYDKFLPSDADLPEPPAGLGRKIMRKIERYERRVLIAKTAGFGVLFIASLAFLVGAYLNLATALTQSGFLNFTSLFFSDFSAAMANFQDFAFSMLESFPVFSAAFVLGGVIVAIWSAVHFINDISHMRGYKPMATL
jgi:fatty-acid desaturase